MSHLPRRNQYELFMYRGKVFCFDDPSWKEIDETDELHMWFTKQNNSLFYPYKGEISKSKPICYYLQPSLYLIFKLTWQ
ncbi:hypothetical protein EBU94_05210 [bacterium]|nr:hypothetical protein [bacterium]